jgi:hypothetical protein
LTGSDHADDRESVSGTVAAERDALAEGVAVRKIAALERGIDDDALCRRVPVGRRERAAAHERDVQGREKALVDAAPCRMRQRTFDGAAVDAEHDAGILAGERKLRRRAGLFDAGQCAHGVEHVPQSASLRCRVGILRRGQCQMRGQHVGAAESRVLLRGVVEAAQQQAGAGKQGDRERNLHDNQRRAHTARAAAAAGEPRGLVQRRRLRTGRDERGGKTEHQRGDRSDGEREPERARVDGERRPGRQQAGAGDDADAEPRGGDAERRADRGEQRRFGQQLARDVAAPRARAQCRVASSARRADKRASSRLATFASAISRTSATATCSTSSSPRVAAGQLFAQWTRAETQIDVLDPARVRTAVARGGTLDVALHDCRRLRFDLRCRCAGREPGHDRREVPRRGHRRSAVPA